MNSAVDTLLKTINDLSARVSTLEAEKWELIRRINELESRVRDLQSPTLTNDYRWNTTINTNTNLSSTYWRGLTGETVIWAWSYVSDLNSNDDWTFTLTYSDGRTVTLGN